MAKSPTFSTDPTPSLRAAMDQARGIAVLRRMADATRRQNDLDCQEGASAIDDFLAGEVDSLDEAFGQHQTAGQRKRSTRAAIAARDTALREAASMLPAGLSTAARARRLWRDLLRYERGDWRVDQYRDHLPAALAGTSRAAMWRALRAALALHRDAAVARELVPSDRTIRRAISGAGHELPAIHGQAFPAGSQLQTRGPR